MTKYLKFALLLATSLSSLFLNSAVYAQNQVSGQAWLDRNVNGVVDDDEPGIGGVIVVGQDETGVTLETVTADDGSWSLSAFDGQRVVVQYILPDEGPISSYQPSMAGMNTVHMLSLGAQNTNINAGYFDPTEFCVANPELVVSRYTTGDPNKLADSSAINVGELGSVYSFPYYISGGQDFDDYRSPTPIAAWEEMGAIWGLAWDEGGKKLYQSAVVKRHTGTGPLGIGGIYVTDLSFGNDVSEFVDLAAAGVDVGELAERNLPVNPEEPSLDPEVYTAAGKIGIGGIDLSPDGQTLYAINLAGKELVSMNTTTASIIDQINLPEAGCLNGETRPFALHVSNDGDVLVGAVCSAENGGTADDLSAHVFKLENNTFESILAFPLSPLNRGMLTGGFTSGDWQPWSDEWIELDAKPVPMLTDLELDDDGSLILAFSDRTGFVTGLQQLNPTDTSDAQLYSYSTGGDIMRACLVDGAYVIEGETGCALNRTEGEGGLEYYTGEQFEPNFETALGGIALLPGSGEVATTVTSPFDYSNGGVRWLDNQTGETKRGYQATPGNFIYFGGVHGLGDVEVICRPAPVDIGSRVWRDVNNSGVYDAGDSALPNVPVELLNVNTNEIVAAVISDANGRFGFSTGTTISSQSYASGIKISPDQTYQLRITMDQGAIAGLTIIDSTGAIDNPQTLLSNDAVLTEQRAVINFSVNQEEQPTELDFGFTLEAAENSSNSQEEELQPNSNVVGAGEGGQVGVQVIEEQTSATREVYGIPIDPNSRLFLAVAGLLCMGLAAIVIGTGGLFWTFRSMRKYRAGNGN